MFCVNTIDWGIYKPEQKAPLALAADAAIKIVQEANQRGQVMSLNFNMYQDGQVSPETLDFFHQLKSAVYQKKQ